MSEQIKAPSKVIKVWRYEGNEQSGCGVLVFILTFALSLASTTTNKCSREQWAWEAVDMHSQAMLLTSLLHLTVETPINALDECKMSDSQWCPSCCSWLRCWWWASPCHWPQWSPARRLDWPSPECLAQEFCPDSRLQPTDTDRWTISIWFKHHLLDQANAVVADRPWSAVTLPRHRRTFQVCNIWVSSWSWWCTVTWQSGYFSALPPPFPRLESK